MKRVGRKNRQARAELSFDGASLDRSLTLLYCCIADAKSLHWGLSPGPSVYKTDALPLSYKGSEWHAEEKLCFPQHKFMFSCDALLAPSTASPHKMCAAAASQTAANRNAESSGTCPTDHNLGRKRKPVHEAARAALHAWLKPIWVLQKNKLRK